MAVGTRSSEEVKKDILDQVYADDRIGGAYIEVEVTEGRVVLVGTVPAYTARRAAQEDAEPVPGVTSVDNQLEVQFPPDVPLPDDADIRTDIMNAFHGESELEGADIDVSVLAGWVILRGTVDAFWRKRIAEEIVSASAGVRGLTNELAVVPSRAYEDRLIADSIVAALERNVHVDVGTIDVRVNGGEVTLSGSVSNLVAFRVAQSVAEDTPGVAAVDNDLEIH
jgi:osmotically-inducible protein OsmY